MIQHEFDSIHNGIYESLGDEVHQQDVKVYAPLTHKSLGFGELCAMAQLDWFQTKSIPIQGIDLYGYRNKSEPMLWFEDLHDGWPRPSTGFTWCPSMLDLFSNIARQNNTKLREFNQNFWLNLSHDTYMNRLGLQNT